MSPSEKLLKQIAEGGGQVTEMSARGGHTIRRGDGTVLADESAGHRQYMAVTNNLKNLREAGFITHARISMGTDSSTSKVTSAGYRRLDELAKVS